MRIADISNCRVVAIDYETKRGVSKDAEAVSAAFAFDNGQTYFFAWGHESGNNCGLSKVQTVVREIDRRGMAKVFHNAKFDFRVGRKAGLEMSLENIEDTGTIAPLLDETKPGFSLDDLAQRYLENRRKLKDDELIEWCAAHFGGPKTHKGQVGNFWRAPGSMVERYCKEDARVTYELYREIRPKLDEEYDDEGNSLSNVYEIERKQFPILMRMYFAGVKVDVKKAERMKDELTRELDEKENFWNSNVRVPSRGKKIKQGATMAANSRSPIDMGHVLQEVGITPGVTPKSGKPKVTKAVLKDAYERTGDERLIVGDEIRSLKKMIDTFIQGYVINNADAESIVRGEFHPLRSEKYGTISGRYSSGGDLNLQNLPARDGRYGPMIRSLFVPFSGRRWAKIDYSQIEYRFLAHYAGRTIGRKFKEDPTIDFHKMVAQMIGWWKESNSEAENKRARDAAKNINFGIVYGMGKEKLARSLGVGLQEAQDILADYNRRAPEIKELYYLAQNRAASRGYIRTWQGRVRRYPRIRKPDGGYFDKTHSALNGLLQGSAADMIKLAMIAVDEIIDWENEILHLTVHDELDLSVRPGAEGDKVLRTIKEAMEDFDLNVPVIAEIEHGMNWGKKSDLNPKGLTTWEPTKKKSPATKRVSTRSKIA